MRGAEGRPGGGIKLFGFTNSGELNGAARKVRFTGSS